jgi:hypothetical protein
MSLAIRNPTTMSICAPSVMCLPYCRTVRRCSIRVMATTLRPFACLSGGRYRRQIGQESDRKRTHMPPDRERTQAASPLQPCRQSRCWLSQTGQLANDPAHDAWALSDGIEAQTRKVMVVHAYDTCMLRHPQEAALCEHRARRTKSIRQCIRHGQPTIRPPHICVTRPEPDASHSRSEWVSTQPPGASTHNSIQRPFSLKASSEKRQAIVKQAKSQSDLDQSTIPVDKSVDEHLPRGSKYPLHFTFL